MKDKSSSLKPAMLVDMLLAVHRDGLFWVHLRFWAPLSQISVDRIKASLPYDLPNCRASTVGANLARKDDHGDNTYHTWATDIRRDDLDSLPLIQDLQWPLHCEKVKQRAKSTSK